MIVQFKDAADVGQRGLFSVDAVVAAGVVAFDDHAAKDGRISVVKIDDIHLAGEFSRLGVIAALRGVAVAGLLIITGAACGRV